MNVVLDRNDASQLKKALLKHGYTDIHAMMALNDDDINSLTFDLDETSPDRPILKFDKALLTMFLDYVIHKENLENGLEITGRILQKKILMISELVLRIW